MIFFTDFDQTEMLFLVFKYKKNERVSTSGTKKIRLFPFWWRFCFLGYGYESQFLASVYERSIDAFDF